MRRDEAVAGVVREARALLSRSKVGWSGQSTLGWDATPLVRALSEFDNSSTDPVAGPYSSTDRVHRALHTLWTKAVGTLAYDKGEWRELEAAIRALAPGQGKNA